MMKKSQKLAIHVEMLTIQEVDDLSVGLQHFLLQGLILCLLRKRAIQNG